MSRLTKQDNINIVMGGGGHVVILGAGASIASTKRNPELNNKQLPSMDNFIDVVGLRDIVNKLPKELQASNFEALYSNLYATNLESPELKEIEKRTYDYFRDMKLPPEPTIYDYLVLSLRPKDVIATFNWDPFLYQAFKRNSHIGDMPYIYFLHGNTAIGYCKEDGLCGPAGWRSKATSKYFEPTKLLYPIAQKNYTDDDFIKSQWDVVEAAMRSKDTKRITVFGYGAPASDTEAVKLLNGAWGSSKERDIEEVEIIDIRPERELRKQWSGFIHETHYDIRKDFFESVIAHQPRRTNESFFHHYFPQTEDEAWIEPNPVPNDFRTMQEMWDWYKPLIEAEERWKRGDP